MYHKRTTKNNATNPVARAIARKKLNDALVVHKIKLYMLADGESCAQFLMDLATTLAVVGMASELDPSVGADTPQVRVLLGGLSACNQLIERDKWDSNQAVAIETALDNAELLNKRVGAVYITRAWNHIINFQP